MRITILAVPGCPHVPLARERVVAALDGRDVPVETVAVHDAAEAAELAMAGSPTILVDGVDLFATAGAAGALACRLYRAPDGTLDGAPSVEQLRAALSCAGACCDDDVSALVGRGGQGRVAPEDGGLRAVHQAVLRHFAATGEAPGAEALEPAAAAHGRTAADVLADLAREDFLTVDAQGAIRAAYPFSAVPTAHRVLIGDVPAWSMCAIDALGIPAMLGRDVTITSRDPVNGRSVTVTSRSGDLAADPPGAVVFAGQPAGEGTAEDLCCGTLNFFTGPASASAWRAAHPEVPGRVVDLRRAQRIGTEVFGPLLRD
ncbi:alkylmercury lyase family protein [Streptomyces sp. NPDC050418]|uniref:alkylmercury lyase family protein n=1 Tax=Streptomyces sp. NPDC050418 TaxID=3365612 RepID=UPI0037922C24